MVSFNEFKSVFNEFGGADVLFLLKNNPHPNGDLSYSGDVDIDFADSASSGITGAEVDDVKIVNADILVYKETGNQKIDNISEYKDRYDLQAIINDNDYDYRMVNGECQILLFNKHNNKFMLYNITSQITQPSLESSVWLWGTYTQNLEYKEIQQLATETGKEVEFNIWLSSIGYCDTCNDCCVL